MRTCSRAATHTRGKAERPGNDREKRVSLRSVAWGLWETAEATNRRSGVYYRFRARGARAAQAAQRLALDFSSGRDLTVCEMEPGVGLCADGSSLPLHHASACTRALSLNKLINVKKNNFGAHGVIFYHSHKLTVTGCRHSSVDLGGFSSRHL